MVRDSTSAVDLTEDYEALRQANIKANLELMASLGLDQSFSTPKSKPGKTRPRKSQSIPVSSAAASTSSATEDGAGDSEGDVDAGQVEDYEAQRQANIKANLELMMSLGLYQASSQLTSKAVSTPKPKPKSKPSTLSTNNNNAYGERTKRVQRPKRITRSVSRTLGSPRRTRSLGLKRALSDNSFYPSGRKCSRLDGVVVEYNKAEFDGDSEDDEYMPRARRTNPFARGGLNLNPYRAYRDKTELQRSADRLGVRTHDPKTFGAIPGIPIGTIWSKRMNCSTDAVHAPTVAGISGNEEVGCWSICLSGGYEDDIDSGQVFTYTGSGGRDLKGTKQNPKNLRTAPQSSHQKWEGKNAALRRSVATKRPVRVVRGFKANNRYAPAEGYVYSGLYRVTKAWMEMGRAGFRVCKFRFERIADQDPLPTFDHDESNGETETVEKVVQPIRATSLVKNQADTIDLTLEPEEPASSLHPSDHSQPSHTASSPHPILRADPSFDRASYIIISDDESDAEEMRAREEEQEVLLQLELHPHGEGECVAANVQEADSWKKILTRGRIMKRAY